ncbi:MAG: APC family permease [Chloroherpetonaceae bacterium]|nr:APC family permease [Chloroherpetonaceae bacterium]MCS7210103.1 APC family permease [Chloroherpetonaceae bacterium]
MDASSNRASNEPEPTLNHAVPPQPAVSSPATDGQVKVVVVTSVMLSFISFWRAAAIVLGDLASTAYYIGGITERAIGEAAPYFIFGVMLFAFAVRLVYIESCSIFTRGGVYRVVRNVLGEGFAKVAVSALMFDYVLTGPISSVSAGQYLSGLINSFLPKLGIHAAIDVHFSSQAFAIAIITYFWWVNTKGITESSTAALRIIQITGVMIIVMLVWCGYTLYVRGVEWPRFLISFNEESLGFLTHTKLGEQLLSGKTLGLIGIVIALGHSMLAMSGEESLAQVYREIAAPKLSNLKRAAVAILIFSVTFTGVFSFLAVMIIPDEVRVTQYADNLLSGLAMHVEAPESVRLGLQAFVVLVGFLILSSAVNTSFVGANGVLNRVAEDGILADWFRKPHPVYGTSYRMINMIALFQLTTVVLSRGDVYVLGEAYAFGVIWSFVFNAFSMLALRFKDRRPREFKVPLNIKIGDVEFPVGILLVLLVLLTVAVANLFTKSVATVSGVLFTIFFLILFSVSERLNRQAKLRRLKQQRELSAEDLETLEKFNQENGWSITPESIGSEKPRRVLVAVKRYTNLEHLDKCLEVTDTDTTDIIVMTVRVMQKGSIASFNTEMTSEERKLFTEVVNLAEEYGKPVIPIIVPGYNAFFSIVRTAKELGASEVYLGESQRFSMETELEELAMIWGYERPDEQHKIMFRVFDSELQKVEAEL